MQVQEVHGACGGDSEGGFWDLSRAFEAEHSCSSLRLISHQNAGPPLYPHNGADQPAMIGAICGGRKQALERNGARRGDVIVQETAVGRGLRGGCVRVCGNQWERGTS